jgi:hypothetical protein
MGLFAKKTIRSTAIAFISLFFVNYIILDMLASSDSFIWSQF